MDTTLTRHSPSAVLMLVQRLRRWPNIEPTLAECRPTMFEGKLSCQYTHVVSWLGRCRSSIYGLAMIWELALNAALGMKNIFSIIMI